MKLRFHDLCTDRLRDEYLAATVNYSVPRQNCRKNYFFYDPRARINLRVKFATSVNISIVELTIKIQSKH